MCARNAVFSNTEVVSERMRVRDMLCFTIETAVGGCEGRRCETAGAAMVAYLCLWSPMFAYARLWSDPSAMGKCNCNRRWSNAL